MGLTDVYAGCRAGRDRTGTAVYVFCLRPMRRGRCGVTASRQDAELDRQIAELRDELRILRAPATLNRDQALRNWPSTFGQIGIYSPFVRPLSDHDPFRDHTR